MNEKNKIEAVTNATIDHAPACQESDTLVAYLYGEARGAEAKDFESHLTACAVCRDELAAFGGVRSAVVGWRDASLSLSQPLVFQAASGAPQIENAPGLGSALRALREFFDLSPLWLKTGGALATLLVCALAAFALTNTEMRWDDQGLAFNTSFITRERTVTQIVSAPSQSSPSQDEIDAMVNARVAQRLRSIQQESETVTADTQNQTSPNRNTVSSPGVMPPSRRRSVVPPAPSERPQLVRRETSRTSEAPRLYDLLSEVQ